MQDLLLAGVCGQFHLGLMARGTMGVMILQLEQISKSFGGRVLFAGVNLRLEEYDHLALVGPNGAGKTTLLRIISGEEDADEGRVVLAKDARIGYLE